MYILSLGVILSIPLTAILTPFIGFYGPLIALGISLFLVFILMVTAESRVKRMIRGRNQLSDTPKQGLLAKTWAESLEVFSKTLNSSARKSFLKKPPRIEVVADPIPALWAVRSQWSRGTLLLSKGLLQTMDERGIRTLLQSSLRVVSSRFTPTATAFAYLLDVTRRIASPEIYELLNQNSQREYDLHWIDQERGTPWSFFLLLLLLPIQRPLQGALSSWKRRLSIKTKKPTRNCELQLNDLNLA